MVDFNNGRTHLSVTFHRNLVRGLVAKKEKKCQEYMELLCVCVWGHKGIARIASYNTV